MCNRILIFQVECFLTEEKKSTNSTRKFNVIKLDQNRTIQFLVLEFLLVSLLVYIYLLLNLFSLTIYSTNLIVILFVFLLVYIL